MMGNTANSHATIDNSIQLPDYFSCKNCIGYKRHQDVCDSLRQEGNCAKQFLQYALQSGQVQIVLQLPNEVMR